MNTYFRKIVGFGDFPLLHRKIITVTGPIAASELGFCHSHEHLFIENGQSAIVNPDLRIDEFDKTVAELELFKKAGGESIVDAQPVGCGRVERWLLDAAVKTGVKIIASTGFHKLDFYPANHWIRSFDAEALTRTFVSEILDGMFIDANRGVPAERIHARAGIIKTAIGKEPISGRYRDLYSAAAAAAKETGVPMLCHVEPGADATAIKEFLAAAGVSAESIILCHLDRLAGNAGVCLAAVKTGVYLEFDTIGRPKYHSDTEEIGLIRELIDRGYEDRILLGLDSTRARMKSYGGTIGLDYLKRTFIPLLKHHGVSQTIIDKFVIHNPSRALSNKAVPK